MTQIPTEFYVAIGVLVLFNLGTMITVFTYVFKSGKFVATTELGIGDAKSCAVRAHKRIDAITGEKTE